MTENVSNEYLSPKRVGLHPQAPSDSELLHRFTYHPPTGIEQVATYAEIRAAGLVFATLIRDTVPPGRSQALALTAVEEAVMHANAGIARAT